MAELGVAYLSVVPSMKNVRRSIESAMVPAAAAASTNVGRSMGSRMTSGLVTASKVAGGAITGVLGYSLVKGFQRMSAIENAKAKLTGLGNSADTTSQIMDNALKAVKGTAFGMDEAATTAASAVAAGIKPGQQLQSYLGLVGDAATIAGVSMQDMGGVFNKVVTSGKVQGDTFQQMSDMGIPVVQMLAKTMGISADEVYALGSKGKISSDQFLAAMESMRGAALQGGKTTSGAFKNMTAALSRFGAALLTGIYPAIGPTFNLLTDWIDKATAAVTPLVTALSVKVGNGLRVAGQAVLRFVTPLKDLMNLQVLTPDIVKRMGLSADSPLGKGMTTLIAGVRAFAAAWRSGNGVVLSSGFEGFMQRSAFAIQGLWNAMRRLDFSSWDKFKASLGSGFGPVMKQFEGLGKSLKDLGPAFSQLGQNMPNVVQAFGGVFMGALTAIVKSLAFLAQHIDTIVRLIPVIAAGFLLWRGATQGLRVENEVFKRAQLAMMPVTVANNGLRAIAAGLELAEAKATRSQRLETEKSVIASMGARLAKLRDVAAMAIHKGATLAMSAASKAAAGAQWLLNAALSANPISLIVIALVALVAGLVVAYNRMGWFKNMVNAAWAGIKAAVSVFVQWFQTYVWPVLSVVINGVVAYFKFLFTVMVTVWGGIFRAVLSFVSWFIAGAIPMVRGAMNVLGSVFTWLYTNVILPVWNWIKGVISGFVTWVQTILIPGLRMEMNILGAVFRWLYTGVIIPVWNGIKWAIQFAWTGIQAIWNGIKWFINFILIPAFQWLWTRVNAVWNGIVGSIRWAWGVVQAIWNGIKWFINFMLIPAFQWLWARVNSVWNGIVTSIRWAWGVVQAIWNSIKWVINYVLIPAFQWLWNRINAVWNAIVGAIRWAWNAAIRPVWDAIHRFIDGVLIPAFQWLRDRIRDVWNAISNKIRDTWNWIRNAVLNPLKDYVTGTFVNAWRNAVNWIKTAWDKLADAVKKPIKFAVDTVINKGFIGGYNKIRKFWNGAKMDPLQLGFSGGGFTGPGRKYDPAGVVHAGEYVVKQDSTKRIVKDHGIQAMDYLNATGDLSGAARLTNAPIDQGHGLAAGPGSRVYGGLSSFGNALQSQIAQMGQLSVEPSGLDSSWSIQRAARIWNGMAGVKVDTNKSGNVPRVPARQIGGAPWAGYYDTSGIQLNIGQGWADAKKSRPIVAMHEIGHALGLPHSMGTGGGASIMDYGSMYSLSGPSDKDAKALQAIYPGGSGKGYSGGSILGGVMDEIIDLFANPVRKALAAAKAKFGTANKFGEIPFGTIDKMIEGLVNFAKEKVGDDGGGGATPSGSVKDWMTKALKMKGLFSESNLAQGVRRIMQESGGNVKAVNNWDSNARAGTPSKGLMQVIDPTFRSNTEPGHGDIWNPIDNILASINYTLRTYGSLGAGWGRAGGYAEGGLVQAPKLFDRGGIIPANSGVQMIDHQRDTPDYVLTDQQWALAQRGMELSSRSRGDVVVNVQSHAGEDPTVTGRRAGEALAFNLSKVGV